MARPLPPYRARRGRPTGTTARPCAGHSQKHCRYAVALTACLTLLVPAQHGAAQHGAAQDGAAQDGAAQPPADPALTPSAEVLAIQQAVVAAIERAEPSVVAIARAPRNEAPHMLKPDYVPAEYATGVVVDAQGLILTTAHALGRPAECDYAVWVAGRPFPATVKTLDPWIDLAILSIEASDLVPITMGSADDVKKGQFVVCLGNPYAIARDGRPSATWGIVSNIGRKSQPPRLSHRGDGQGETVHQYGTLIQTDARLYQGTSGGAMLNLRGEMIGLTTSLAALDGYDRAAGYAIPMSGSVRRVIEQLEQGRQPEYGFLGVAPEHLSLEERQQRGIGTRLTQVENGTPAARSGLRPDDVITHVAGQPVYSPTDLIRLVSLSPVGTQVPIQVRRQNALLRREEQLRKQVVLSKRHVAAHQWGVWSEEPTSWRGMTIDYATAIPAYFQHSNDVDPEGCIVVMRVQTDSAAWKAGLREGMFISHVGDTRVATPQDFYQAVAPLGGKVQLRLTRAVNDQQSLVVE